ncbi:MAG: hypothetical protein ACR2GN_03405 [Bacteroidia bacterium]
MKYLIGLMTMVLVISASSCKKEAGEGGNSLIHGKVWVKNYNVDFSWLNGEYPGYDEDVFIIYGNDSHFGDRTRTTPDGYFEFKYLRPGNYTLYVYSEDSTMNSVSGDTVFYKTVTISSKKEKVDAGTFIIYD